MADQDSPAAGQDTSPSPSSVASADVSATALFESDAGKTDALPKARDFVLTDKDAPQSLDLTNPNLHYGSRGPVKSVGNVTTLRIDALAANDQIVSLSDSPSPAAISIAENTTAVTTVTATDADPSATLTYSIVGGADAALFTIDPATGLLSFVSGPNYENPADAGGDNVYDVTVQVSDGTYLDTQDISVTVTNVNDNPPAISSNGGGATAAISIAENTTAVTTVTATDADPSATLTYSIVGGADAALFTIDPATGLLSFVSGPNYENPADAGGDNVYDVTVQVSDGTYLDTQDISVTVTNVNDNPPAISSNGGGATAAISIAENTTAVTTVTATDADPSATLTYSIVGGADAALFTIDPATGLLSFVSGPNYENPADAGGDNVYDVTVQVSDGTYLDTQDISVTVTNVNDNPPAISSNGGGATAAISIAENTTAVTTVTATDADPSATLTYSIVGGADAALFTIDPATGLLSFVSGPNYENPADAGGDNVYDVTVQVSDGTYLDTQDISVTVTNVNDNPPAISSNGGGATAAISIAENTTAVTTVTATDADPSATLTYSIVGGADAALFTIDPATGLLSFVSGPNYENPADAGGDNVYDVTVQVSDGTYLDTQDISVTVTNVNDNPPAISSNGGGATAAISIAENTTAVTTVTATDADPSATLTYSIVGGADAALFTIDPATGLLSFVSGPNYENPADAGGDNVYDVTVQVSDGTYLDTQDISVTVTNVNDNPPAISSNGGGATAAISIAENTTAVTTVTATDADPSATLTYSIVGGADAALFTIDPATGLLSFVSGPNYENPADAGGDNVYDVTVQVSDGTYLDTQDISVTVTNVNDNPPAISSNGGGATAAISIAENTTAVTTVTATDADPSATLTYSIVGGADAALFTIDPATGLLSFVSGPNYENPADAGGDNVYDVTVQVSDGTYLDTQDISVTVTNVSGSYIGTSGNDTITGSSEEDIISTGAGNDTIIGFVGTDRVDGGSGTDTIVLTATSTDLNSATNAQIVNVEAVSAATAGAGVAINLANQTETFTITGSAFADTITGGAGADTISAGSGNDTIIGFVGADRVDGGSGTDTIILTATSTTLNSATNARIVNVEAVSAATAGAGVTINLANQTEAFTITGSAFNDTITGGSGNDTITGGAGADTISAGSGNDTITGGAGADTISAGSGNDTIMGFVGADTVTGGSGTDTIVLTATSTDLNMRHQCADCLCRGGVGRDRRGRGHDQPGQPDRGLHDHGQRLCRYNQRRIWQRHN